MNITYLNYQAEQVRNIAERREADERAGELAAAFTHLGYSLRRPVKGRRDARREGRRALRQTVACAVPRA